MKKVLVGLLTVGFLYLLFSPEEAWSKIIRVDFENDNDCSSESTVPGKQYLFLIAIDEYLWWPGLRGPVNEALLLKKVLSTRYHFDEIIELYNQQATKEVIRTRLIDFQAGRENQLSENDSLFIYFSGHGYCIEEEDWNGYWIPYNGGLNNDARAYWFSNFELAGLLNKIKARHILIVSDSCFASTLVADEGHYVTNEYEDKDKDKDKDKESWRKNYNKCSRKVLTSGGLERVPGQSVFARLLVNELNRNPKPWIDIAEIYRALEWKVFEKTGNHPGYGDLKYTNFEPTGTYILFAFPSLPL